MGFWDKFFRKRPKNTKIEISVSEKKSVEPTYDTKDRYQLEHMILRQWILGADGANIISAIIEQKGDFFIGLYKAMHENEENYSCPYSSDDFNIKCIRLPGGKRDKLVLQLQMPNPERVPLCSNIFILHNEQFENRRYITLELSASGGYMICEWNGESHSLCGKYSEETLLKTLTE